MTTPTLDQTLDRIEEKLPAVPRASFRLQRAVADRSMTAMQVFADRLEESGSAIGRVMAVGVKTVAGTARWVTERTAETFATGLRTLGGQTRAQAARTRKVIADEVEDVTDDLTERVEKAEREDLATMSKADLYEKAQELDIDGRSAMSKDELVAAIAEA